jgi:hypothetical protein
MRFVPRTVLLLPLLFAVGCFSRGGFSHETSYSLEAVQARSTTVDAPARDQKVTVKVTSDVGVNVYVAATRDLPPTIDDVNNMLNSNKKPQKLLASAEKVQDQTLELTVPAKTEFQVIVYNPTNKSASVKVKVDGK